MFVFVKKQQLKDKYVCLKNNKYILTSVLSKAIKFDNYQKAFKFKPVIIINGITDSKIKEVK